MVSSPFITKCSFCDSLKSSGSIPAAFLKYHIPLVEKPHSSRSFEISIILLLTIKLQQTIGKVLAIDNWSIKARGGNCLLLPVSSYAYGGTPSLHESKLIVLYCDLLSNATLNYSFVYF